MAGADETVLPLLLDVKKKGLPRVCITDTRWDKRLCSLSRRPLAKEKEVEEKEVEEEEEERGGDTTKYYIFMHFVISRVVLFL